MLMMVLGRKWISRIARILVPAPNASIDSGVFGVYSRAVDLIEVWIVIALQMRIGICKTPYRPSHLKVWPLHRVRARGDELRSIACEKLEPISFSSES
jgi:hypothetical protein